MQYSIMDKSKIASVSVIIPFYSHVKWLDEAIQSVLLQTLPAHEIIVINDGSKENISKLEEKYRDMVTFLQQENQGAAVARNLGIEKSDGDFIAFLDSDDLWEENKLEIQIREMEKNKYIWSATGYITFGWGKSRYIVPYCSDKLCWEHLYNTTRIATPTVIVYRKALEENKFAKDMKNGQDIYLWYRLANRYKLGVINEPLVKVRIRKNSTCRNRYLWARTRAMLWDKMGETGDLFPPNRFLTKQAYKISSNLYKKWEKEKENWLQKIQFVLAWAMFQFDEFIFCIKEPDVLTLRKK